MSITASIVVPIYNSKNRIRTSIEQVITAMNASGIDYEILCRDDASSDGSKDVLQQIENQYAQVKCFYNLSNEGLGSTLRKLFLASKGGNMIYCDCDLPYGAGIIPVLHNKLRDCDIAVASRYRGASNEVRLIRKIFSRCYYFLCKILFDIPVADIGSGSVAMRRAVFDKLNLRTKGFDIHAEIYVKAARQGFRIEEIPAQAGKGTPGSFCLWKHGPRVLIQTVRLCFEMLNGRLGKNSRE